MPPSTAKPASRRQVLARRDHASEAPPRRPKDNAKLHTLALRVIVKGTGPGTWISKGIVQKYGGSIRFRIFQSGSGNATSFQVYFPELQHRTTDKVVPESKIAARPTNPRHSVQV